MPVLHVEKKGNFTQVTIAILRDPKMSLKAKGLLTLMLSMDGDRWTWSVAGLASLSRDGVDSVREGLKELHRLGYFFSRNTSPSPESSAAGSIFRSSWRPSIPW